MKELLFKSLICLLVIILSISVFASITYADNFDIEGYDTSAKDTIKNPFQKAIGAVLGAIRIIGSAVALIMIIVVAIKYMSAAPGERADLKKSSVQYVVGAVILFGSSNILTIIITTFSKIFP